MSRPLNNGAELFLELGLNLVKIVTTSGILTTMVIESRQVYPGDKGI